MLTVVYNVRFSFNMKTDFQTCSCGSHHHAEREFFLEDRLDEHHVQVADDGPVDDHYFVAFDYS